MPELPEVETTKNGVLPHIQNKTVKQLIIRQHQLRWPIPHDLPTHLDNAKLTNIERRAKYLLCHFKVATHSEQNVHSRMDGVVLIHLGMSGNLRIVDSNAAVQKHDHVDFVFTDGTRLRYCDPRRFGSILWLGDKAYDHALLANLGPEPLSDEFCGEYLWELSRNRHVAVKQFVMDQKTVTGIGNIYATEALFAAGLRPNKPCGKVSKATYTKFANAAKRILEKAISQGGTTLKDFVGGDGKPGYFKQELLVYGRAGQACVSCGDTLKDIKISNRASAYCPTCQK